MRHIESRVESLHRRCFSPDDIYRRLAGVAWCRGLSADDLRDEIALHTGTRPNFSVGEVEHGEPDWRARLQNRAELARQAGDLERVARLRRVWAKLAKKNAS